MKYKQISQLSKESREKKLKELRLELIKAKSTSAKTANAKSKEIKKDNCADTYIQYQREGGIEHKSKYGNMSKVWLA